MHEGKYSEIINLVSTNSNTYTESTNTNPVAPGYPYDLNGNIRSLIRFGKRIDNISDGWIDQLSYYYSGNQLIGVNDVVQLNNIGDFYDNGQIKVPDPYDESTWEYNYDANGNLTEDKNKGIFGILYNTLNLPISIQKYDGLRLEYIYDATGTKRRQNLYIGTSTISKTTDFIGNIVYENGVPAYVNYGEGRMVLKSNGTWFAEIYLKDHLGNIRVAFSRENGGGIQIRQVNSYYPFGMNIKELSQNSTDNYKANEYLYNGKMMQDEMGLNWLDYGARFYDAVLGRWHSPDPLAEQYRRWSPYNYCVDNPMRFIDPDGMRVVISDHQSKKYTKSYLKEQFGTNKMFRINSYGEMKIKTQNFNEFYKNANQNQKVLLDGMKEVINKQEVVKVYINEKSDNFHFEEKVGSNSRTKNESYGLNTNRAGLATSSLDPKGTYVVAINNQRANNEPLNGKNGTQTGKNASATFFHEVLDEGLNHHINKGSESNPVKYQNAALENLNLSPRDASDHVK